MIQAHHNQLVGPQRFVTIVAAMFLFGCATPQERMDARIAKAQAICSAAGISSADPRYQDCTLQMYQADQQQRAAAAAQLINSSVQLLTPKPAPPPPQPTMCSTYVNGQYISTRCY